MNEREHERASLRGFVEFVVSPITNKVRLHQIQQTAQENASKIDKLLGRESEQEVDPEITEEDRADFERRWEEAKEAILHSSKNE